MVKIIPLFHENDIFIWAYLTMVLYITGSTIKLCTTKPSSVQLNNIMFKSTKFEKTMN